MGHRGARRAIVLLTLTLGPTAASGACTAPAPPPVAERPEKPPLPEKPACLSKKEGCPGWEAYSYNDAIKAYNARIEAFRPLAETYLRALNTYVKAAADYAQCEAKAFR